MTAINTDSGSLFPDNSLVESQLNPPDKLDRGVSTDYVRGGIAPLWDKAYVDLTRLGTLDVNGEPIYKNSGIPSETEDTASKTTYVFEKVADKLDSSALAVKAAHLFEQDLGGGALKMVANEKGISTGDEDAYVMDSSHTMTAKRTYSALNTDDSKFTLIHEQLIEVRPMEDIERVSYFKVKTVVNGRTAALETKDSSDMSTSIAYTKEYTTMKAVLKADYWGTRAGFWNGNKTYIKA